jgi:hypothetical protein
VIPAFPISGSIMTSATDADEGGYICEITNTMATALTLFSRPVNLTVEASGVPSKIPESYSMNVKEITADKNLELGYALPEKTNIRLSVYDVTGKVIKEISKEEQPGFYSRKINMDDTPTGVYFVRMEAGGKNFTNKVLLVK